MYLPVHPDVQHSIYAKIGFHMPDIKFNCTKCGAEIEAEATLAGKIIQCPKCRQALKAPENMMAPGMMLGGYELCMLLGKGGMGEVWLSTQNSMERKVALKILSPSLSKDPDLIARFVNEMKMIAKLDHPGIVSAYDAGSADGLYYLATSYVEGETLQEILDSGKVFGEREALLIVRKVAEALLYAWDRHKILHRDIKPANIMIEHGGAVKLMDMGISKSLNEDASITMTGIIVGTPYYMSPEQAKADRNIDLRSDIYSLGATLYHMLTGELPYTATNAMGILARVISEPATPVTQIKSDISPECEALISRMMSKGRKERQVSWQEVIDDIDNILDGEPGLPAFIGRKWNESGMRMKVATVIIAIFAVLASCLMIMWSHHRKAYSPDEELLAIANEDYIEPAGMDKASSVARTVASSTPAKLNKPAEVQNKPVESGRQVSPPQTAQVDGGEKIFRGAGGICIATLANKLGISQKDADKLVPVIKEYFRDLKQLRDTKPAKGSFILAELREKIDKISNDTRTKAEAVVPKDKAAKLVEFLEEERKAAIRNNLLHPGEAAAGR